MVSSFTVVMLSKLKGAKRLDADRYQKHYLELESHISSIPCSKELTNLIVRPVRTGHTPSDRVIHDDDSEIDFVKTDTVREGIILFENCDKLPSRSLSKNDFLKNEEVLVTIIGADFSVIGRAAIFRSNDLKAVVNQNIAVIRTKKKELNPYYFTIFLNSRFGREQLWMLSRQTEQVNLNCREVEKLLVPLFDTAFQQRIENLAKGSYRLLDQSKRLDAKAQKTMLKSLRIQNFKPREALSYSSTILESKASHRLDAEYFQPKYGQAVDAIATFKPKELGILARPLEEILEPQPAKKYKYIEISDMDVSTGDVDFTERTGEELPANARIKITGGELIVSKVRPTRGAIGIVPFNCEEDCVCSGAFSVFKIDSPFREFSQVFLRSCLGKLQLEKPMSGTSYPTINDADVWKVKIPIISHATARKISDLVIEAQKIRAKAKAQLKEAISLVELAVQNEAP